MISLNRYLDNDWSWKEREPSITAVLDELEAKNQWLPTTCPTEIHVDLLKIGKIPDPRKGFNEHVVQYLNDKEFLYQCKFPLDSRTLDAEGLQAQIVFEGLDTICDVYLNGKEILKADNQFRVFEVDLAISQLSESNVLLLHFKSATLVAKEREAMYGAVRAGSCNLGDPSRVYVRKAQYDWRWDWGPELLTAGPYRPVILRLFSARLSEIFAHPRVSETLQPSFGLDLTLSGSILPNYVVVTTLRDLDGNIIKRSQTQTPLSAGSNSEVVHWDLTDSNIMLWWPKGSPNKGKPNLYEVQVILQTADAEIIDSFVKKVGFRRAELVQQPLVDAIGTSFFFRINNVKIFIGGSNWIPADSFLTTVTPQIHRDWLNLLSRGNQNMIRVWGGGVYEPEVFYDICDELGIMVWQDFQFACGIYPAHESFVTSVAAEAEDNVRRLRHHPSLVLFCGNNEDYQQIMQWGENSLPAVVIYEDVLPKIVSRLTDPEIPYHRGSPYGGKGWDTTDPTVGDIHQWNVWAGPSDFYQNWDILSGRFVSEFGLPAIPDIRTVDYWMDGNDQHRYPQSRLMQQHNKAGSYERRLAIYMNENFRINGDFESYIFLTQIMQSEGLSAAYRVWRREWRGDGKEYNGGVLVWQLNDLWPVTSWAIVDYFMRPKPAYYAIARELRPYTVGIERRVKQNRPNDRPRSFYEAGSFRSVAATVEIWGTNSTAHSKDVRCEITCFDLLSDWTHSEVISIALAPNSSTEIKAMACPSPPSGNAITIPSESVVATVRLVDPDVGAVLARYSDWPQPFKFIDFPDPGLQARLDGEMLTVRVSRPVKGLVLSVAGLDDLGVIFSDNGIDVVPDDIQQIECKGLGGRALQVAYLGAEQRKLLPIPRNGQIEWL